MVSGDLDRAPEDFGGVQRVSSGAVADLVAAACSGQSNPLILPLGKTRSRLAFDVPNV